MVNKITLASIGFLLGACLGAFFGGPLQYITAPFGGFAGGILGLIFGKSW
jgi:hypothetical protein